MTTAAVEAAARAAVLAGLSGMLCDSRRLGDDSGYLLASLPEQEEAAAAAVAAAAAELEAALTHSNGFCASHMCLYFQRCSSKR